MPNSGGNFAISGNQPAIAFPMIQQPNKFYLFTVMISSWPWINGLTYSVIDMGLNGGLGDVVSGMKNLPMLLGDSVVSQLTAIRHHNNQDVWVVARRSSNPSVYLAYHVSASGIAAPVISPSSLSSGYTWLYDGHLRISPDGARLVCSSLLTEYCTFDDETGVVTPLFTFTLNPNVDTRAHGAEFSVDSKKLYLSETYFDLVNPHLVYQFDATKTDSMQFIQSKTVVGSQAGYSMQMGPDGKIYINHYVFSDSLAVINNPSSPGTSCNFQAGAVKLNGNANGGSLSTFFQKYNVYIHHVDQCPGDTVYFTATIWPHADSIHWDFGDPASGDLNTSNLPSPWHQYAYSGTYTVTLIVRHEDNRFDTAWKSVNIFMAPMVALGPDTVLCAGQSILFDAGSCTGCTYQWANLATGQMNIGTGQTYTATTAGVYMATVTGPNECIGRDTVTVTLGQPVIIGINIAATATEVCEGTPVTFTATAVNGGSNPIYRWKVNGVSQFTGSPVYTYNPSNGDIVTCELTSSLSSCISANPVTSNVLTMTVNPILPVSVSVTASVTRVCEGIPVTFTATPVNGGATPSFSWFVNGANLFTGSPVYTYTPNNGDQIFVICNSSIVNCISNNPATSNTVTMTVNPNLAVSVTVTPSSNPFCQGEPVTFTAVVVNGGAMPSYQWKVNGINAGTNSPVFTYTPNAGDQIFVTCHASPVTCVSNNPATSNTVTMVVNTTLPAGVTIAASDNPFCPGTTVTFTATPVNGGSSPTYQWLVNGAIQFTGSPFYQFTPQAGDSIRCIMTSNLSCVTGNPAGSNKIIMTEKISPTVTFTPCFDTITTVNARPFRLRGGLPVGGTYSGPGVNSAMGLFTPSTAGPGTHQITYTYQNTYGCEATKQSLIHSFTHSLIPCGSPFTDIRDGKTYPTVQIGSQCWMQKNLEFGMTIDELIPQTDNCIAERYNRQSSIVQSYMYQWDELMTYQTAEGSQGLCPPGWHVPSELDWTVLFNFYQGASRAGRPLQDTVINGFKALMSGVFYSQSFLNYQDFATILWSSTPSGSDRALAHGMNTWNFSVSLYPALRSNGFGVRCVREN